MKQLTQRDKFMKSDKNCPDIRALVNVYCHWGSHWTPPGARLDTHDEMVFKTWSSKVRCGSSTTPRSLADDAGTSSFPSNDILKSRSLASNCLVPKIISFVLSGFKSRKLLKHQLRIKRRSLFSLFTAIGQSRILKEIWSLVKNRERDLKFSLAICWRVPRKKEFLWGLGIWCWKLPFSCMRFRLT